MSRQCELEGCTIMITIPLSTEDLTKVRLAPSPLWETVTSFGVLLHHGRDTVHAPWAARRGGSYRAPISRHCSPLCAWRGTARTS